MVAAWTRCTTVFQPFTILCWILHFLNPRYFLFWLNPSFPWRTHCLAVYLKSIKLEEKKQVTQLYATSLVWQHLCKLLKMNNAILHIAFGFYFVMLNYQSLLSWKDQMFIEHLKSVGGGRYIKVSEKGNRKKKQQQMSEERNVEKYTNDIVL